jgi:hypothetical protein
LCHFTAQANFRCICFYLQGFIRFTTEGAAQKAIDAVKAANDGNIVIRDVKSEVRVLEGWFETS